MPGSCGGEQAKSSSERYLVDDVKNAVRETLRAFGVVGEHFLARLATVGGERDLHVGCLLAMRACGTDWTDEDLVRLAITETLNTLTTRHDREQRVLRRLTNAERAAGRGWLLDDMEAQRALLRAAVRAVDAVPLEADLTHVDRIARQLYTEWRANRHTPLEPEETEEVLRFEHLDEGDLASDEKSPEDEVVDRDTAFGAFHRLTPGNQELLRRMFTELPERAGHREMLRSMRERLRMDKWFGNSV